MGLFDSLFGNNRTPRISVSLETTNVSELKSSILSRDATRLKDEKKYDDAVSTLRLVYAECAKEGGSTISTFLRLPMMLQLAGRWDEAWGELNRLLITNVTGMMNDPEIGPMERSQVYDKMRLHLQREKKHRQAIAMAVLSYTNWAIGLRNQRREEELEDMRNPDSISGMLLPLLKKAKCEDKLERLVSTIREALVNPQSIDQGSLVRRINEAVGV